MNKININRNGRINILKDKFVFPLTEIILSNLASLAGNILYLPHINLAEI